MTNVSQLVKVEESQRISKNLKESQRISENLRESPCSYFLLQRLGRELLGRTPSASNLESVLVEFIEHYNEHRPHRSLTQRCQRSWDSDPVSIIDPQLVHLRQADRLGGLIHEYRMIA